MAEKHNGNLFGCRIISACVKCLLIALGLAVVWFGCDTFPGNMTGDPYPPEKPKISFANVPVEGDTFSFAPVVYWKGSDADGFVELYAYADITDSAALLDPEYYIDYIPEETWIYTTATSDTVYLLTEAGRITEHVFYLKCVDDQGYWSDVIYRAFYRSNRAPNVAKIKWWSAPDAYYNQDTVFTDTLYCLDEITDTWSGLGFNWKSSDPDDRDLYTIPLQFKYYLKKVPNDTIWQWVSREWTSSQELMFSGLQTGHYTFTVWTRDDGLDVSALPASATFDVYKPTFEQQLLLLDLTEFTSDTGGRGNVVPGSKIGDFYQSLAQTVSNYDYVHLPSQTEVQPWKSFLGRYKLILMFSENYAPSNISLEDGLRDYLNIGGRLWIIANFMRKNAIVGDRLLGMANSDFTDPPAPSLGRQPDFIGTISGVDDLPDLGIDTSKIAVTYSAYYLRNWDYPFLPGVDIMASGEGAETVYYYKSYTDTLNGDVVNDLAEVRVYADSIYYPPTPIDCIVRMPINKRLLEISRVENTTRGVIGEVQSWANNAWHSSTNFAAVVRVSYPYGEPWSVTDTIRVDYRYQPTSEMHLRPCAFRYEKLSIPASGEGIELRYRLTVFSFPLYFMDNNPVNGQQVEVMFRRMYDWFFSPAAH